MVLMPFAPNFMARIMDCFMAEPAVRSNIGAAIRGHREKWIIQGHIGSTWQDGQYKCEHDDVEKCRVAFEDLLTRLETDYIDLGMIHFVDRVDILENIANGPIYEYIKRLKPRKKQEAKTMARETLSDMQVEEEIVRLQESPYVKLANKERRVREKRRMYLYHLRQLEKKGRALEAAGITSDVLDHICDEQEEYGED